MNSKFMFVSRRRMKSLSSLAENEAITLKVYGRPARLPQLRLVS
jgi:hypothetical protein